MTYFVEDFSIGPINERWMKCIFTGETKRMPMQQVKGSVSWNGDTATVRMIKDV